MTKGITEVWYACYGSNIREERFMCYIQGGTPPGALKNFSGCKDTTEPKDTGQIIIDHEMYFARESPTWNGGGICFLDPEKDTSARTLGRTYLINSGQFIDLVRQELKFEGDISIDFEQLREDGYYNCLNEGRYGLLLYLGEKEGAPVVTFTSEVYLGNELNAPDITYLSTIINGMKEIYDLKDSEMIEYFSSKKGLKNSGIQKNLLSIISAKNN